MIRVLGGFAAITSLAGCAAIREPTEQPSQRSARIEEVQFINHDSAAHIFVLKIETDGVVTYEDTHEVAPATEERVPVVTDDLPNEEGEQTVSVEVASTEEREKETVTFESDTCYSVLVEYSPEGIGLFSASGDDQCRRSD